MRLPGDSPPPKRVNVSFQLSVCCHAICGPPTPAAAYDSEQQGRRRRLLAFRNSSALSPSSSSLDVPLTEVVSISGQEELLRLTPLATLTCLILTMMPFPN